jgi:hypothetical protein
MKAFRHAAFCALTPAIANIAESAYSAEDAVIAGLRIAIEELKSQLDKVAAQVEERVLAKAQEITLDNLKSQLDKVAAQIAEQVLVKVQAKLKALESLVNFAVPQVTTGIATANGNFASLQQGLKKITDAEQLIVKVQEKLEGLEDAIKPAVEKVTNEIESLKKGLESAANVADIASLKEQTQKLASDLRSQFDNVAGQVALQVEERVLAKMQERTSEHESSQDQDSIADDLDSVTDMIGQPIATNDSPSVEFDLVAKFAEVSSALSGSIDRLEKKS